MSAPVVLEKSLRDLSGDKRDSHDLADVGVSAGGGGGGGGVGGGGVGGRKPWTDSRLMGGGGGGKGYTGSGSHESPFVRRFIVPPNPVVLPVWSSSE